MTTLYVDNIAPNLQSKISAPNLQLPSGSVVQVATGSVYSGSLITSTSYSDTGLAASITPTSASSDILVIVQYQGGPTVNGGSDGRVYWRIFETSTSAQLTEVDNRAYDYGGSGTIQWHSQILQTLHSPSTTSTLTYKLQGRFYTGSELSFNTGYDSNNKSTSFITLMEIAG